MPENNNLWPQHASSKDISLRLCFGYPPVSGFTQEHRVLRRRKYEDPAVLVSSRLCHLCRGCYSNERAFLEEDKVLDWRDPTPTVNDYLACEEIGFQRYCIDPSSD